MKYFSRQTVKNSMLLKWSFLRLIFGKPIFRYCSSFCSAVRFLNLSNYWGVIEYCPSFSCRDMVLSYCDRSFISKLGAPFFLSSLFLCPSLIMWLRSPVLAYIMYLMAAFPLSAAVSFSVYSLLAVRFACSCFSSSLSLVGGSSSRNCEKKLSLHSILSLSFVCQYAPSLSFSVKSI